MYCKVGRIQKPHCRRCGVRRHGPGGDLGTREPRWLDLRPGVGDLGLHAFTPSPWSGSAELREATPCHGRLVRRSGRAEACHEPPGARQPGEPRTGSPAAFSRTVVEITCSGAHVKRSRQRSEDLPRADFHVLHARAVWECHPSQGRRNSSAASVPEPGGVVLPTQRRRRGQPPARPPAGLRRHVPHLPPRRKLQLWKKKRLEPPVGENGRRGRARPWRRSPR